MKGRLSITEVAKSLGITPRTIMRWEKSGKIKKSKRDWRGWRFYSREDIEEIRRFFESAYDYNQFDKSIVMNAKEVLGVFLIAGALSIFLFSHYAYAGAVERTNTTGIRETKKTVDIVLEDLPVVETTAAPLTEGVKYTLGPDDQISIEVRRHPEFSGDYKINAEGKIEYKYIGDIIVSGMTKDELKVCLTEILSEYVIEPEVNVLITAYLSKVFYVVGEVGNPGKFYMRGDTVTVREALVQSSLPTQAAAMRRCRLITPNETGRNNYVKVNVYDLMYYGDLGENIDMKPGDVLYVPATVVAKAIRVISPVTNASAQVAGTAAGAAVKAAAITAL
ncbi:MAG: polysaccharide biosynthesis/export family protein [Candidatus Omnitrophica bacterium]|nr:polysaccharide biosynthesis/export family protein [Candidatus Omnitrophota bacterium]